MGQKKQEAGAYTERAREVHEHVSKLEEATKGVRHFRFASASTHSARLKLYVGEASAVYAISRSRAVSFVLFDAHAREYVYILTSSHSFLEMIINSVLVDNHTLSPMDPKMLS